LKYATIVFFKATYFLS